MGNTSPEHGIADPWGALPLGDGDCGHVQYRIACQIQ
jgi:hypothetical protein